jgi:UDP-N-acetyl-2-amino-2-deoxyglucuronate dehydrogenase
MTHPDLAEDDQLFGGPVRFALVGAAGYIAPRHIQAIKDVGGDLVAAADPHDSVGVLDKYFPECHYFKEIERFDRHLDKLRRVGEGVHYVSICSPNYLHDAHIRLALRNKADAICEKPLVVNPWNFKALQELQLETDHRVWTVFQLRLLPHLQSLKEKFATGGPYRVKLDYITPRGRWYAYSWKGSQEQSGGKLMNIGVHLFDLLLWLFGEPLTGHVDHKTDKTIEGSLVLERAHVEWRLSLDGNLLPLDAAGPSWRLLEVDGERVEFSPGFSDLHTKLYEHTLLGKGFTLDDAKPSIDLIHKLSTKGVY